MLVFLGITVSELVFAFIMCFKYNLSHYRIQWAANWINLLLQDLLLAPTVYLLWNYLLLLLTRRNKKISKDIQTYAKKLLDESLIDIQSVLNGKEVPKSFEVVSIQANTVQVKLLGTIEIYLFFKVF